jgi:hypothetical protein
VSKKSKCKCTFFTRFSPEGRGGVRSDIDFIILFDSVSEKVHDFVRKLFAEFSDTDYFYSSIREYQSYPVGLRFQFFLSQQIYGDPEILGRPPTSQDLSQVLAYYSSSLKDQLRPLIFRNDLSDIELFNRAYSLLKRVDDCIIRVQDAIQTGIYPKQRALIQTEPNQDGQHLLELLDKWQSQGHQPDSQEIRQSVSTIDTFLREFIEKHLNS